MKKNNKGFTLLESLIACAILAIGMQVFVRTLVFNYKSQANLAIKDDKEMIKRQLLQSISCSNTIGTGCTAGQTIILKDGNNNNITNTIGQGLFQGSNLMYRNWYVKATCATNAASFSVQVAKRQSNNAYAVSPLNQQPIRFEDNTIIDKYCSSSSTSQIISIPINLASNEKCASPGSVVMGLFKAASIYSGVATCPTGTKLIGGGVNCDIGSIYTGWPPQNYGMGQIFNSYPDMPHNQWVAKCCMDTTQGQMVTNSNQVYAICQ